MRTYTRRRPEIQVIEGVHNLCRLCLEKSEDMLPIFAEGSDGICATLSLRIMICVGLEVTKEDCLPNIICSNCHKELDRYYTFRKKCEVSYQKLKLHLQATREKDSLRKAIEERELVQEMKANINCIDKYDKTFTTDEFSDLHVLDLNTLHNVVVDREKPTELQEDCNVNAEIVSCTGSKEIEAQIHDADNPEISSFLSTVLIQLGILEQQDSTMSIVDHGVNNLELVMGDDDTVTLELTEEEDDSVEESQALSIDEKSNPVVLNGIVSESARVEDDAAVSEKAEEQVMTIKWKPEPAVGAVCGVGGVGRAWCGACHKWLATRATLRRHLRVHTGERPHACRDCGRRFAQREVLQRHRLLHQERRPFECAECGKGFTQRGALQAHARAHAPPHARALHLHACTCCPKVFLYPSSLSRHMMMHKGRIYGCSACQRQFRDKSSLQRHLRSAHNNLASQAQAITYYEQPTSDTQPLSSQTQPLSGQTQPLSGLTQPLSAQTQPLSSEKQHSVETQPGGGDVTG